MALQSKIQGKILIVNRGHHGNGDKAVLYPEIDQVPQISMKIIYVIIRISFSIDITRICGG